MRCWKFGSNVDDILKSLTLIHYSLQLNRLENANYIHIKNKTKTKTNQKQNKNINDSNKINRIESSLQLLKEFSFFNVQSIGASEHYCGYDMKDVTLSCWFRT